MPKAKGKATTNKDDISVLGISGFVQVGHNHWSAENGRYQLITAIPSSVSFSTVQRSKFKYLAKEGVMVTKNQVIFIDLSFFPENATYSETIRTIEDKTASDFLGALLEAEFAVKNVDCPKAKDLNKVDSIKRIILSAIKKNEEFELIAEIVRVLN